MENKLASLQRLDTPKLIDVVKNYKQYGYDEPFRQQAINILKERGITEQELKLTGNFSNQTFENAASIYGDYTKNSTIGFSLYLVLLVLPVALTFLGYNLVLVILDWLCYALYIVFFIRSFLNHSDFYKTIGKPGAIGNGFVYFLLGMPLYIFMYFLYRGQMKEEMQAIQ